MTDQQQKRETQQDGDCSRLNQAVILSPGDIGSTSSKKFLRRGRQKMIEIEPESDEDEEEGWLYLLTKSASKQITPVLKNLSHCGGKTTQLSNQQGCKYDNMCSICLSQISDIRGRLICEHEFCFSCIEEWCKTSSNCPCCRIDIPSIIKLQRFQGRVTELQRIMVSARKLEVKSQYDFYVCYQCGLGNNEHILLICDSCDFNCCHTYCDLQMENKMQKRRRYWFCLYCREKRQQKKKDKEKQKQKKECPNNGVASRTRSQESTSLSYCANGVTSLHSDGHTTS